MGVDPNEYRRVMGCFASGVSVVTAPGPHGMTVSSLASVSLEPVLLLVCLEHGTPTLQAVHATGLFAVNLLDHEGEALSNRFAFDADPFAGVDLEERANGLPRLRGGLGFLACSVWSVITAGDHDIVVGEVERCDPGAPEQADPLLYFRSRYRRLAADTPG